MKEQMKEEGVTSDIGRELYGMCTGENEKMIGELMVVEKLCCNQGNLSIYSLIKHQWNRIMNLKRGETDLDVSVRGPCRGETWCRRRMGPWAPVHAGDNVCQLLRLFAAIGTEGVTLDIVTTWTSGAGEQEDRENHKAKWHAAVGRTNVWVGENLLITEEDTTDTGGQQLGRSGMGGQGAEPWENKNDEARWRATLGGNNVGVGEDLLLGEGAVVAASCA
jgi:hypothetical protein